MAFNGQTSKMMSLKSIVCEDPRLDHMCLEKVSVGLFSGKVKTPVLKAKENICECCYHSLGLCWSRQTQQRLSVNKGELAFRN